MRRCSVIYPAPTVSMQCDLNFSLRVRGSIRFPKPWAQGSRCVALALGPSQRCSLPIVIHAHHWRAFAITFSAQGTLMMRKPRLDRHLRIIGMPRRSVAKYGGGLPMMRFAQRSCVYRIIGMPSAPSCIFRRRTANDAVVTTGCALPHHWHAFHAFCIVLACIC